MTNENEFAQHDLHQETLAPLSQAVGEVALADAECDEWLMQVIQAILNPLSVETVRTLVAGDSAGIKMDKIKRLLREREVSMEHRVPDSHRSLGELFKSLKEFKSERDRVIHSFHEAPPPGQDQVRRFRSRNPNAESVATVGEIRAVAAGLKDCAQELNRLVLWLEATPQEDERHAQTLRLLEDARELLVVGRLIELERLEELSVAFQDSPSVRVALGGYGRWRVLSAHEDVEGMEVLAVISRNNGVIELSFADGLVVHGGDTGWRNITELAQSSDPAVVEALLRRIHNNVTCEIKGASLSAEEAAALQVSLASRIFGSQNSLDLVPRFLLDLEGFRPASN